MGFAPSSAETSQSWVSEHRVTDVAIFLEGFSRRMEGQPTGQPTLFKLNGMDDSRKITANASAHAPRRR